MSKFQKRVSTKWFSPKGTKYDSPGQGRASVARQAAALGLMRKRIFGRARGFTINRHVTEADTRSRFDFVLGRAPSFGGVNRSDDGEVAFSTQGFRPGLSYFALSGQSCCMRWLHVSQNSLSINL